MKKKNKKNLGGGPVAPACPLYARPLSGDNKVTIHTMVVVIGISAT